MIVNNNLQQERERERERGREREEREREIDGERRRERGVHGIHVNSNFQQSRGGLDLAMFRVLGVRQNSHINK